MEIFIKNLTKSVNADKGSSVLDIFNKIDLKDKESILVCKNENILLDWNKKLHDKIHIEYLDFNAEEAREVYRHSTSHIMAHAVKNLFKDARITIGPDIEDGFYYDFDLPRPLNEKDLENIENEMKKLIKAKIPFIREELSRKEAIQLFKKLKEDYKVEILNELQVETVSLYKLGDFIDLCRGPHLEHTGKVKAFKLLSVAGAYWRGDEKNKMLQRIYGTSFDTQEHLDEYLAFLKETEDRDHRKLGKQLDLYSIQDTAGAGFIFWHPNGAFIRMAIEDFWRVEHLKRGYQFIYTPHLAKLDLWKLSGHWDNYRENMYSPIEIDNQQYMIKPMNCPGHILIFKSHLRSYRELPLRWAEMGTVYRYERSGVLHGMLRVRGFTQDDAHIFCTTAQLQSEIEKVLDLTFFMLRSFGFEEYRIMLSTKPEKHAGTDKMWEQATDSLRKALESKKVDYKVDPGEGVFYGPKIDIKLVDALKRGWQGPTIQVDFIIPERFNVNYIGEDGHEHRVVMIHRAVLGSFERFVGTLIEHYKGAFPIWMAPVQVMIITITDNQIPFGERIKTRLEQEMIRVEANYKSEKFGNKVREAITRKIPFAFILGKKEEESGTVSLRGYKEKEMGTFKLDEVIKLLKEKIDNKSI
ncbi:MAG: threonine--tRNA ligase [Spirochaetes bacterium]|nr:threonine--tRNA ligase [Spirochaetota bacterium]